MCDDREDMATLNDFDVEESIANLCSMGADAAKSNSKRSGVSLGMLKAMAVHLGINKSQNKGVLIDHWKGRQETTTEGNRLR